MIFLIATGSSLVFGTSIALGAFIAGLVIGQTNVRHQASANSLPLKDTFAVIFFLSVGMLFDPRVVWNDTLLFFGIMGIILLVKPIVAYVITIVMKHKVQTAVVVAIALAQIGEFSFILSEEAMKLGILPDAGYDVIVACALFTIALNPLLFKVAISFNKWLKHTQEVSPQEPISNVLKQRSAVIVGFGPIGQNVAKVLEGKGLSTVIVDTNVDTITKQIDNKKAAVYGDASIHHILEAAHIETASILVITTPEIATTLNIIETARLLNPMIKIFARSLYSVDQIKLKELGVVVVCDEESSKAEFINLIQEVFSNP
jgi:CPA2 family monovalent cation:H+ antiporter-2